MYIDKVTTFCILLNQWCIIIDVMLTWWYLIFSRCCLKFESKLKSKISTLWNFIYPSVGGGVGWFCYDSGWYFSGQEHTIGRFILGSSRINKGICSAAFNEPISPPARKNISSPRGRVAWGVKCVARRLAGNRGVTGSALLAIMILGLLWLATNLVLYPTMNCVHGEKVGNINWNI